jgi:hypothetical protein
MAQYLTPIIYAKSVEIQKNKPLNMANRGLIFYNFNVVMDYKLLTFDNNSCNLLENDINNLHN